MFKILYLIIFQHLYAYVFKDITVRALGNYTPIFLVVVVIHACVSYYCLKHAVQIFLVTLMLVHVSSKKMCL